MFEKLFGKKENAKGMVIFWIRIRKRPLTFWRSVCTAWAALPAAVKAWKKPAPCMVWTATSW